jgi:hypothetical protein
MLSCAISPKAETPKITNKTTPTRKLIYIAPMLTTAKRNVAKKCLIAVLVSPKTKNKAFLYKDCII